MRTALSNSFSGTQDAMIEIGNKFSNKSEMINVDKNSVWVVPDGIGSI